MVDPRHHSLPDEMPGTARRFSNDFRQVRLKSLPAIDETMDTITWFQLKRVLNLLFRFNSIVMKFYQSKVVLRKFWNLSHK